MFTRFLSALALLCIAPSIFGGGLRDNELIIGGGSSQADGLWISGPSLVLRRDNPGIVVGAVQTPGKERGYAYVLIIKGDEKRRMLARYDGSGDVSGSIAHSRGFVEIASKVAFAYEVKVGQADKESPRESLSINGTALDLRQGRVVMVDLSTEAVRWKQVRIDLPAAPTWPMETAQVEAQARKLLDHLRSEHRDVRGFLNGNIVKSDP